MGKVLKQGKVVVVLAGRQAGKKALVVKTFDDGTKERPFGHALIAGVERYPLPVTKGMSKKKIVKRSKVKPFLKYVNYQHLMPTRYSVDVDTKNVASSVKPDNTSDAKKELKKVLQDRYLQEGKVPSGVAYFFKKLRF